MAHWWEPGPGPAHEAEPDMGRWADSRYRVGRMRVGVVLRSPRRRPRGPPKVPVRPSLGSVQCDRTIP